MRLPKDELDELKPHWHEHPYTHHFRAELEKQRESCMQQLLNACAGTTDHHVASVYGAWYALNLTLEENFPKVKR